MIKIEEISKTFKVRRLTQKDIDDIYNLCEKNLLYYQHCKPFVSKDSIFKDMKALPNNKEIIDKYYLGFFDEDLIAIIDLIDKYPNDETVFVGFFMVDKKYQNKKIGTKIMNELFDYLKKNYKYLRLGYVDGNHQSRIFWLKNGFKETGLIVKQELYNVVVLQKEL